MSLSFVDVYRPYVLATLVLLGAPATVFAQFEYPWQGGRPLLVVGALYDGSSRTTAEGGISVPFKFAETGDDGAFFECLCLEAIGSVGAGGHRFAIGPAFHVKVGSAPFLSGVDALVTVLRTSDTPRGARPSMTYVGAEGGFMFMSVRTSIGFAHPVSGPGPHDAFMTWNVGYRVGW